MNIKGLHKTSLIDFPNVICSVLFSGGCNLRCKYCYNPELACDNSDLDVLSNEEILDFLKQRKGLIEGITLSGGEPLLRNEIFEFLQEVKKLNLKVKLDTNGFFPDILQKLLQNKLIDYLAIDIKTSPEKYEELTECPGLNVNKLSETINIAKKSQVDFELRTTCIPDYITMEDLKSIKKFVGNVKKYYLQQFINEHTLNNDFLNVAPYEQEILCQFRDYIRTFAQECEVRGI